MISISTIQIQTQPPFFYRQQDQPPPPTKEELNLGMKTSERIKNEPRSTKSHLIGHLSPQFLDCYKQRDLTYTKVFLE